MEDLQQKFVHMYGYVSKNYQTCVSKVIGKLMNKILLQPIKIVPRWKIFESFDPYNEVVTQSSKFYE
jgi:hypothetical protein